MTTKKIPLNSLEKSDLNERRTDDPEDSESFQDLVESIAAVGLNDPPTVRLQDEGGYEIVTGSRRVRAARHVDGIDEIECSVKDMTDGEALQRTITDNIKAFREDVSPHERARALSKLWAEEGDTRDPSPSGLGNLLGVSASTINDWLEPLSDDWEDTFINPLPDFQQVSEVRKGVFDLSVSKLGAIRMATGGGEDGERLANEAAARGLTLSEIEDAGDQIADGLSVTDAAAVVDADDETTLDTLSTDDSPESSAPDGSEDADTPAAGAAETGRSESTDPVNYESDELDSEEAGNASGETGAPTASATSRPRGGSGTRMQPTAHTGGERDMSTDAILGNSDSLGGTGDESEIGSAGPDEHSGGVGADGEDAGDAHEPQDWETSTSEIPIANETTQTQLQEAGAAVSLRTGPVPTGPCQWVRSRGGEREGAVLVAHFEDVDPRQDAELAPYLPWSGFESLGEWRQDMGELPERGSLYLIAEAAPDTESTSDEEA